MSRSRGAARICVALLSLALASCKSKSAPPEPTSAAPPDPLPALRAFEAARRASADFETFPRSNATLGIDPWAIVRVPGKDRFLTLLRGRDALVLLDAEMHELARLRTLASASGLAVAPDGRHAFVVGEHEGLIEGFGLKDEAPYIAREINLSLGDVVALRGVAAGPEGVVYTLETDAGILHTHFVDRESRRELPPLEPHVREPIGGGPIGVERVGSFLVIDQLFAHALVIRPVDASGNVLHEGEARIQHDGPIWGFSAIPDGDGLLVLAGGVEDHPLDRRGGFFGYIDSFVFLYRVTRGEARLLATVNVSELGVVTPKAMLLEHRDDGSLLATVTGYGGERMATIPFDGSPERRPGPAKTSPFLPGARAIARLSGGGFVVANPLLDALVVVRREGEAGAIVPISELDVPSARSVESRVGEALFFTTLMAPDNGSEGAHSRFTCETCHFEGYVDGRVHHTGRGDVRVVTKPLLGLFNNRPHFSRALDPDLSSVAHNEFRVAGADNGHSPWFSLDARTHPVLEALGAPAETGPLELRRALMTFLMDFSHRQNPRVANETSFSTQAAKGAEVFLTKCEACHEARLAADEPDTRVPFDRWQSLVFSPAGPIVWASADYKKTGVLPYVHERGARVPSLRRLAKKRPYLTSGAAKDLDDLLTRVGWDDADTFYHDAAPEGAKRLEPTEREALRAFLDLL